MSLAVYFVGYVDVLNIQSSLKKRRRICCDNYEIVVETVFTAFLSFLRVLAFYEKPKLPIDKQKNHSMTEFSILECLSKYTVFCFSRCFMNV